MITREKIEALYNETKELIERLEKSGRNSDFMHDIITWHDGKMKAYEELLEMEDVYENKAV